MLRAKITGTGMCVPARRVTNQDLEALMDTSDEWIRQRSGIAERRWVEPGETPADLAEKASRQALEGAGLEPGDDAAPSLRRDVQDHGRPDRATTLATASASPTDASYLVPTHH